MMAIDCKYQVSTYEELSFPAICDFDLNSNKYSWVNELSQNLSSDSEYGTADLSEVFFKKTTAYCREKTWLEKDLLGGR